MHLLFLDESGIDRGARNLIVAGMSLHEEHLSDVSQQADELMERGLSGTGLDPADYEFHATDLRHAHPGSNKPGKKRKPSAWVGVPEATRMRLLRDAYSLLGSIRCGAQPHGCGLFGVVVDSRFHKDEPQHKREQMAYEHLLVKFDDSLRRAQDSSRGIVIHDRRMVAERDIQRWTQDWQATAEGLKQIERMAMLPLFADSRGSRLLQLADLVCWALQRAYSQNDDQWIEDLWSQFDFNEGHMHGLIHLKPAWRTCSCLPCSRRHDRDLTPLLP